MNCIILTSPSLCYGARRDNMYIYIRCHELYCSEHALRRLFVVTTLSANLKKLNTFPSAYCPCNNSAFAYTAFGAVSLARTFFSRRFHLLFSSMKCGYKFSS